MWRVVARVGNLLLPFSVARQGSLVMRELKERERERKECGKDESVLVEREGGAQPQTITIR